MRVEPVGDGEQEGAVGQRLGPQGGGAEGLGDDRVAAFGGPGCGALPEGGVAGVADDHESARDLLQRGDGV